MRELNPRAWIPSLNRYATGYDDLYYHRQMNGGGEWWCYPAGEDEQLDVELELPTGLKDKNGKEIYDGDILQIDDHILGDFEVLWNNLAWKIKMSFGYETLYVHKPENIVVIGNIHENPELLDDTNVTNKEEE